MIVDNGEEERLKEKIESDIVDFLNKSIPKLQSKESNEITSDDTVMFSLIELCYDINKTIRYNENSLNELYSLELFDDEYKNYILRRNERTGLLTGILKVNTHVFQHKGISNKKGRIYVTRCFELNGKEYVLNLSLDSTVVEFKNWQVLINNTIYEFIDNLKNDTEIVYNNYKEW